jgi:dienelactone hydrolase
MTLLVTAALLLVSSLPSPSRAQQPPPDVISMNRAVLAALTSGEFATIEDQFTPEMKGALPSGRLAALWTALQTRVGALKQCGTEPRVRHIADKQMVITTCEFERTTADVQFAFDSAGRISGLTFRPGATPAVPYTLPAHASPASFTEREITIGAEWALPATLTVPAGAGPWPAVVLVHGSGPHDRDETILANKPFKDLAVGLAARGIAVLRYDKRTMVHGRRLMAVKSFTVRQEVIEDVLEAVTAVRAQPGIDAARVFVLGHSLGGMLIPRIAAADATIAGLIVLAGPARSLEDAIEAQSRYLAMVDGTVSPQEQDGIAQAAALAARVRALTAADAQSSAAIAGAPASYWLDLRGYDPPSEAKRVARPMLILQGERDYQVTLAELEKWKAALGSRRDVTFHSYPALNHLFIAGTGPASPAEYQIAGHVAEEVIRDIATWVLAERR